MPPIYFGRVDHSDLYGPSDDYYSFRTLSVDHYVPFYRSTYPPCRDFSNSPRNVRVCPGALESQVAI